MLIDKFLPDHQIAKEHKIIIEAPVREVYKATSSLDMSKSKWIKNLFQLRGLPESALSLRGLQKIGFTMLGQNPNQELLLGLAGKFWTLGGNLQQLTPEAFKSFDREGFAKAAWNFSMESLQQNKTSLKTETRIYCLDKKSHLKFRCYWLLISPFSSWIRKEILKIIKQEAERAV